MSGIIQTISMSIADSDPFWGNVSALFHFDGSNGDTTTTEQKGNTVTRNGSAILSTGQTKFGTTTTLLTPATTDYWSLADSAAWQFGTGDFTVEGWFYTGSVASIETLLAYNKIAAGSGSDIGWSLQVNGSKLTGFFYNGTTQYAIVGTTTISINTWYYWKWYRLSGTTYLYLNGNLEGTASQALAPNTPGTGWTLNVGAYNNLVGMRYWNGYQDEVRITKGVARTGATVPTRAFTSY